MPPKRKVQGKKQRVKGLNPPRLKCAPVREEFEIFSVRNEKNEEVFSSRCRHCPQVIKGRNTSNLEGHLEAAHQEVSERVQATKSALREKIVGSQRIETRNPLAELLGRGEAETAEERTAVTEPVVQEADSGTAQSGTAVGLDEVGRSRKRKVSQTDWGKSEQEKSNKMLALWIGGSTMPVQCVENPDMLRWVQCLNSKATLPSRWTLTRMIAKIAGEVRELLAGKLKSARRVSITTDAWTSKLCNNAYLGVTAHIYNPEEGKRMSLKLSCAQFDGAHTGTRTAEKLEEILQQYGIMEKTCFAQTDSANTMIKALRDLSAMQTDGYESDDDYEVEEDRISPQEEVERAEVDSRKLEEEILHAERTPTPGCNVTRLPCTAHKVHLVVTKSAASRQLSFGHVVKKVRRYVVRYRRSGKAKAWLFQRFPKKIPGYVITRWWSDVAMCIVFVAVLRTPYDVDHPEKGHLIDALNREMTTKDNPWDIEFNNEDIVEIENFLKLMKPMMTLFTTLNSELESTIHRVYPSVKALLRSLSPFLENEKESGHLFAKQIEKQTKKYFAFVLDPADNDFLPVFWCATLLSPIHRLVLSPEQRKVATTYLKGIVKSNDRGKETSVSSAPLQFSLPELDCLSDLLVEAFESAESQHPSTISNLDTDLALYEKKCVEHISRRRSPGEPRVDVEDPIAFWFIQEKYGEYVTDIAEVAQDLLCCPSTSVPSERLFSISGILSDNRSSQIKPHNLESRVLIKANHMI